MALEIHTVELRAKDSMSPVFKRVGDSANQSARQVTDSFARAGESTRRFNVAAAAMGTAVGASIGILADFSRAAAEDAAGQARLQQSVENTGKSYDEFSDAVDRAIKKGQEKAFSDDATREALVRLNAVTNDTGKSIDQLGLVMDFARTRGISLADSANVIGKVMGGNLGILSRYGIVLQEGATATEALALIQARSSGQADVYANSQLGQLDKMRDKWGELTESIGGSTGELQQFLMLLPGLSAGMSGLSGLAAGVGGFGALGTILAGLVAVGGAGYLAYDANFNPGGTGDNVFAQFGAKGAGLANTLMPGNPFSDIQSQFQGIIDANSLTDLIAKLFYIPPGVVTNQDPDAYAIGRLKAAGVLPQTFDGSIADAANFIQTSAANVGMSSTQYLERRLSASSAYTYDPVSAKYVYNDTLTKLNQDRAAAALPSVGANPGYGSMYQIAQGQAGLDPYNGRGIYNPFKQPHVTDPMGSDEYYAGPGPAYAKGGTGAVANSLSGAGNAPIVMSAANQQAANAANIQAQTDALVAQYPAWQNIITGINSANDATSAFTAAQSALGSEMNTYQAQASEWNSELSAQDAAYEILQQRQNEGIKLTAEQTEFLNNYTRAQDVGTAAVEDATVAAGMAAQSMLLNKETMDASKSSTDDLTDTIRLLILALDGVPEEVRTQVILDTDPALGSLYSFLNLIPSSVTIPLYVSGTQINDFLGGGYQHGGVIPGARHGRVVGGGYTLVGEDGPELLSGGRGAGGMVIPASATRAKMRGQSGGDGAITINGPVNVYANDPMQFQQQLRSNNITEARW
jgi:hypothetical protein